ncbi:MAG TPA: ATP-grasp domain-containing protein [Nocardioidaceae bacterium]|nr:ATP-grasp domain-containing protein [Nocardioidaceae bacterium]
MTTLNVFVLGLDEANLDTLGSLPHLADYSFHPLLSVEELQLGEIDVPELLEKARHQLEGFDGSIDAVVGYWDFPVSSMVPVLCDEYGLRAASLESVVKCEHKYWSRLEQQRVTDAHPRFALVDLEGDAKPPEGVGYPFWLKPVKSFSSKLAFMVETEEQFDEAVAEMREGIGRLGEPFQYVMDLLDLPPEIAEVGGEAAMAEEALSGGQAATEGYVFDGEPHVYGVLDSVRYPGESNFLRHQYPSQLPDEMERKLVDVSERVIRQVGMDWATFSIEFFYDRDSGDVSILEINPRHSQSHAPLFEHVDGVPNHHCIIRLALGRDPELPRRQGDYGIAAIYYYRHFSDGIVRRAPTAEDVDRVQHDIPGVTVFPVAEQGTRLSEQFSQDPYSYLLAEMVVAAGDVADMEDKYERCVEALAFEIDDKEPG